MERIKYLRTERVPFACLYSTINTSTNELEFGWSLCSKDDKFIKKIAVQTAKHNLNKTAPHSIKTEMNEFIDSFRKSKIRKELQDCFYEERFVDSYDLIKKHQILVEVYSDDGQFVGYVYDAIPEETSTSILRMWIHLNLNFKIYIDAL